MSKYRKQRRANSYMAHPGALIALWHTLPGRRAAASNHSFGPHIVTPRTLKLRVSAVQNLNERVLTTATSMIAARPINFINCEGRAGAGAAREKREGQRLVGITREAHENTADANLMQIVIGIHVLMLSNGNDLLWIVHKCMHFALTKATYERSQFNVVR